jgi:hypothetical protein
MTGRRGRTVGNRPSPPDQRSSSTQLATALKEIRSRVDIAAAVAAIVVATLKAQHADSDAEIALALQRCVCDVLADQSDRLAHPRADFTIAGGGLLRLIASGGDGLPGCRT